MTLTRFLLFIFLTTKHRGQQIKPRKSKRIWLNSFITPSQKGPREEVTPASVQLKLAAASFWHFLPPFIHNPIVEKVKKMARGRRRKKTKTMKERKRFATKIRTL